MTCEKLSHEIMLTASPITFESWCRMFSYFLSIFYMNAHLERHYTNKYTGNVQIYLKHRI